MRFILISVAAVVAAASLFAPVQASAADVFERLTSAKLSAILTARGGKNVEVTKPEAGTEVVSMGDESGTQNFVMSNCTAQGCEVMQMAMFFNKDDHFNLAVVNSFNGEYLNAQASLTPDGKVFLVKLFVTVGGVTEDNVKANLEIFFSAPELFVKHVLAQVTASNDPNSAVKPVSAVNKPAVEVGPGVQSTRLRALKLIELLNTGKKSYGRNLQ